ncbi:MAG: sugar phosphate isomerase/epimerase [Verrucomicrobia bacterium]|nr:sugar phosphate isomerase/epimerase [Verrucomicrobiota bacterium]MBU4291708.1 sugar phosphate isomerase/epimerase [Verrucomicrobiota bacterium]MBU4429861.1 sugar phosphate isomerase/epimerase [Verrucomicrobiota bacterium]MCG2681301.1 sugar phosphate isomerase/epimerase [Kiritimatiellia bacterium]
MDLVKRYNFEFLELYLSERPKDEQIERRRVCLNNTGMRLWSIHSLDDVKYYLGSRDPAARRTIIEAIFYCIDYAAALGGKAVIVHPGNYIRLDGPDQFQRVKDSLLEIIPYARQHNIMICLENMLSGIFGERPEDMSVLLAQFPADCVKTCIDTGHGNEAGNLFPMLAAFGARLFTTHLNDNFGVGGADPHLIPGNGNIRWQEVVATLRTGYANPWIFEVVPDPQHDLEKMLIKIKSWCERLEVTCAS